MTPRLGRARWGAQWAERWAAHWAALWPLSWAARWTALPALLTWAGASVARHRLIEAADLAQRCDIAPATSGCAARALLIRGIADQGLGWVAFIAGLSALLCALAATRRVAATRRMAAGASLARAHRALTLLALVAGAAGLALYCVEPAAVGVLLALVALARAPANRSHP